MKKLIMIVVMVAAVALPAMAGWITTSDKQDATNNQEAFQSTSTMQGSGSAYSSTPVLNEDGTASFESSESEQTRLMSGPRKAPGTPGNSGTEMPIGDAVLPLMLMAVMAGGVIYLRRRKTAQA